MQRLGRQFNSSEVADFGISENIWYLCKCAWRSNLSVCVCYFLPCKHEPIMQIRLVLKFHLNHSSFTLVSVFISEAESFNQKVETDDKTLAHGMFIPGCHSPIIWGDNWTNSVTGAYEMTQNFFW